MPTETLIRKTFRTNRPVGSQYGWMPVSDRRPVGWFLGGKPVPPLEVFRKLGKDPAFPLTSVTAEDIMEAVYKDWISPTRARSLADEMGITLDLTEPLRGRRIGRERQIRRENWLKERERGRQPELPLAPPPEPEPAPGASAAMAESPMTAERRIRENLSRMRRPT